MTKICQEQKLHVSGEKHELVEHISTSQRETPPKQVRLYTSQTILKTIKKLGKPWLGYLGLCYAGMGCFQGERKTALS